MNGNNSVERTRAVAAACRASARSLSQRHGARERAARGSAWVGLSLLLLASLFSALALTGDILRHFGVPAFLSYPLCVGMQGMVAFSRHHLDGRADPGIQRAARAGVGAFALFIGAVTAFGAQAWLERGSGLGTAWGVALLVGTVEISWPLVFGRMFRETWDAYRAASEKHRFFADHHDAVLAAEALAPWAWLHRFRRLEDRLEDMLLESLDPVDGQPEWAELNELRDRLYAACPFDIDSFGAEATARERKAGGRPAGPVGRGRRGNPGDASPLQPEHDAARYTRRPRHERNRKEPQRSGAGATATKLRP